MNVDAFDYRVKVEINGRMLERSLRYELELGETLGAERRFMTRDQLIGFAEPS